MSRVSNKVFQGKRKLHAASKSNYVASNLTNIPGGLGKVGWKKKKVPRGTEEYVNIIQGNYYIGAGFRYFLFSQLLYYVFARFFLLSFDFLFNNWPDLRGRIANVSVRFDFVSFYF